MKHIILLCHDLKEGGSEEIILNLARHLNQRKYNVWVVYLSEGPIKATFDQYQIPCIQLQGQSYAEQFQHLQRLVYQLKIHYIFCNYLHWGHQLANGRVQSIEIAHAEYVWLLNDSEYRQALEKSSQVICVSKRVERFMAQHFPQVKGRLHLIENGIDPAKLTPSTPSVELRQKLMIPDDGIVLGTMSRICPEKGIGRILEMARILQEKYDHLYFVLPGDPDRLPGYYQELQQKIQDYNLQRIIFPGYIHHAADYYQMYDIFLFPSSLTEGLQLGLVEALKMGLPVVTTDMGVVNFDADMKDGKIGYVVQNAEYSNEIFSRRIAHLIDHPELRHKMGQNNQLIFSRKYHVREMIRRYEEILANLEQGRQKSTTTRRFRQS